MTKTIKLKNPIVGATGSEIKEVVVNDITTAMYFKNGELMRNEVRTNGNVETVFVSQNMDALRGYMSDCTDLPSPLLNNLHPSDAMAIKREIDGFFLELQAVS